MDQFHLGTVGALRALPSPSLGDGPEATATRLGAVHRSLGGRVTLDRLAVKRVWTLTWPYLDPDTHAYLDALHHGLVAGPVWLLDPQRRNRLSGRVAATGSFTRTTEGFAPSAGTVAWSGSVPDSGAGVAGGLVWTVAATGGQLVAEAFPVVSGQSVCVSAWAASPAVPVGLAVAFYDRANTFAGLADAPTATTPAAGTRLSLTVIPPPSAALARPILTAAGTGGAGRSPPPRGRPKPRPPRPGGRRAAVRPWSRSTV